MLRNGAREKALSRKVMLSLLMAGTMSVCISGGDVWAALGENAGLTEDTVYNNINEIPVSIAMNGHDITSYAMFGNGNSDRSIIGTGVETLRIIDKDSMLSCAIGAFHDEDCRITLAHIKNIEIEGSWSKDIHSVIYTNQKGSITMTDIGNLKISGGTGSGQALHTMGGAISIDAENVTVSDTGNAVFAQLSGTGTTDGVIRIAASGNIDIAASATAVAAAKLSEPDADRSITVVLTGKNISILSSGGKGLASYSAASGADGNCSNAKTTASLSAEATVTIKAKTNAVHAANGREAGDAFISIDAGKLIDIISEQNALYSGSNALVKINDRGTAKVSLTGNVVAENGGQIIVKNADQIGALKVDGGIYNGNNISIKYSAPTLDDRTAVYVANNGSAVFDGDKTEIIINSQSENDPRGVWVTSGGKVEFNAKETLIDVTGVGGSSKWGFGLLLNGTVGGSAVFNGQNVAIKNYQDHYTSQTVTAKAGSEITFNNTGNVLISAKSPFGVTAVDNQGNITFNNSGNVDIVGTIVPGNKSAQTNVVGIQSGSSGAETVVTDKVKDFNITLSGAGVDNDGTSYSTGTYGIILDKDVKALINSATLNIKMNVADNVEDISPGDHTTEEAYGIDPDGGYITVGTGTVTNITIQEGLGTAYAAVNAASATSVVELLGDTTIVAAGKTASYALNAEADGQITVGSTGKTVHLTGDIVAKNDGVINIAGKTNTINGIVKAVDGGTVNLSGASDAVYNNININSFVTQGTGSNGSVKLNGGTMDFGTLNNQNLASNSFVVNGGSLKAASKDIFTSALTAAGTAIDSGDVLSVVNNAVKFESGKLILSDEKYNLAWLKTAKAALNNADSGTMGLVVTGTLVTTDGKIQTEASASDLADTGAVHAGVTGKVDTNDVTIGSSGLENLGVKDLALDGSAADASKVTVGNGKELTLVGSGSENDALVKTSDGTAKTNVAVAVGDSTNAGTLNLGVAGTASGGNLNAAVAIANDDSKVNVDAGTFKVNEISADKGTISVNEGAELKTDSLTVGSAESTVKLSGTGALEAKSMTVNTGTIEVTGMAKAGTLTVNDSNAIISVGTGNSAGSLVAGNADLNGAAVVLDPVWQGNDMIGNASKAALAFTNNKVNGLMTVGRNSVLSLGTDDTGKAEQAFAESELTWGETGVSAALYIDQAQKLQVQGGILLDGTKTAASAEANKASFADGSLLIVNGSGIGTSGTAALTGGSGSTLTVNQGAKLYLTSTNAGTYTIAKGFANTTIDGWSWSADAAAVDVSVNKLSEIEKIEKNTADGDFTVTVRQTDVQKKYDGIALPNILQAMDQSRTEYAGIKYLTDLANDNKLDKEGFIAAVNSFAQGAENSGATRTGALAALDLGTAVQEHLSLAKAAAEQSGGFGKAAVDTADNGGIWAQYIHNKDKVDNMGGVSYDGQYNGVIIGGDFADRGKYSSGIAFSYGSGDSTGSASKNEFDFWGLSYYGGIQNGDTNLIFDVGYSKTSSDVKGVIKAEPDTQVISMGIKGEKLISNGHGTSYVPYAGLRYMNIDTDSYNGSIDGKTAAHYSTDKADLWLLPVGISISHESVTAGGWKVRPTADIAYVWILGDKNTAMDITVPGVNATDRLGYDIMDSGFFVGKLGLEAEKGDWTYGLGYACQKGSHAQNSKFMLNVTYSF